jgi:hypothetical protein
MKTKIIISTLWLIFAGAIFGFSAYGAWILGQFGALRH